MSGGEGGRGRHVVLAGGRGGRVGGRPGGDGRAEAPGQELLVEQAGQEGVGRHHLHLVFWWCGAVVIRSDQTI